MSGDLDALLALYEASPSEIDRRMAAAVRTLRDQLDKSNARQRFYGKDAGHWQRKYLAERSRADFHCERADNLAKTSTDYDTALDVIADRILNEDQENRFPLKDADGGWWWMDNPDWDSSAEQATPAQAAVLAAAETRHNTGGQSEASS